MTVVLPVPGPPVNNMIFEFIAVCKASFVMQHNVLHCYLLSLQYATVNQIAQVHLIYGYELIYDISFVRFLILSGRDWDGNFC